MLTQNKFVRSLVNGIKIKFIETPVQTRIPPPLFTDMEAACVDQEVESLLRRGAIHRVEPYDSQFVSNIFLQPKKSGGLCLIINLKRLNSLFEHNHFKMEKLLSVLPLIKEGAYITSLDFKDAYFALPISKQFQKISTTSMERDLV